MFKNRPEDFSRLVAALSSVVLEVMRRQGAVCDEVAGGCGWFDAEALFNMGTGQIAAKIRTHLDEGQPFSLCIGNVLGGPRVRICHLSLCETVTSLSKSTLSHGVLLVTHFDNAVDSSTPWAHV